MTGTGEVTAPYKEIMVCRQAEPDEFGDWDCSHRDPCDWSFICAVCRRDVSAGPCPDHAPLDVLGLRRIECTEGHARTWVLDDDGYEPPCPWCAIASEMKAHEGCEHSHHGRWRRWRIVHRALSRLYSLGIVKGWASSYSPYCRGCAHGIRLGRNGYLLGWPRCKWQCLLAARYWPGEEVLRDMCGKCNPCGLCGSQRHDHNDGCPAVTA